MRIECCMILRHQLLLPYVIPCEGLLHVLFVPACRLGTWGREHGGVVEMKLCDVCE